MKLLDLSKNYPPVYIMFTGLFFTLYGLNYVISFIPIPQSKCLYAKRLYKKDGSKETIETSFEISSECGFLPKKKKGKK